MKQWVENEIEVYSRIHHAAIQKADMAAWGKFNKAGTEINRLPVEDLDEVPARRRADLVQVGQQGQGCGAPLQAAARGHGNRRRFGYVEPDMYKGLKIDL